MPAPLLEKAQILARQALTLGAVSEFRGPKYQNPNLSAEQLPLTGNVRL